MSSTSRSAVMTVSLPGVLRNTAASSPMPSMREGEEETGRRDEDVFPVSPSPFTRLRSVLIKSSSSFILKDHDEANQVLLLLFRLKWRKKNADALRLLRRRRFRERSRRLHGRVKLLPLHDCLY